MYRAPLETRVSLTLSRHSARTSESTVAERGVPVHGSGGAPRVRRGRRAVHPVDGRVRGRRLGPGPAGCCALRPPSSVRGTGPRET